MSFFRKDNSRTDSFQRQISGLRKQLQGDEGSATDEFRYAGSGSGQAAGSGTEGDESESFASSVAASRETRGDDATYAPSRIAEEVGGRTGAAQSFRPTFQPADANTSVIASNAHWNGTMRTEGSVHIHGKADGELHTSSDVFVAEGAEVDAQLYADNVIVAGVVRGKIEARGRLELLPQGHVSGDVRAPKLIVHEGARLSGQLKMENGNPGVASEGAAARSRRSTP